MAFTRNDIDAILRSNDLAVERGIIRLFELQTADEQRSADTNHLNTVGFCMTDARVGTRFARWLQGMDDNNVVRFAPKSLNHPNAAKVFRRYLKASSGGTVIGRARDICLRHSRQLTALANGEDPRVG